MAERRRDEEQRLRRAWREALEGSEAPDFESQWARAHARARHRRARTGLALVLAAAAALIVAFLVFGPRERGAERPAVALADASIGGPDSAALHARLSFGSLSLRGPTDFLLAGTELSTESLVVPSALLDTRALRGARDEGGRP